MASGHGCKSNGGSGHKAGNAKSGTSHEKIRHLAEAMILQSIEDFWSRAYRCESVEFFNDGGFETCAEIAGMGREEQSKVLKILKSSFNSGGPLR